MQEIKCPNCGQVFQVDESGYAQIVQQIRDREFAQELDRREQELKKRAESDLSGIIGLTRKEEVLSHAWSYRIF